MVKNVGQSGYKQLNDKWSQVKGTFEGSNLFGSTVEQAYCSAFPSFVDVQWYTFTEEKNYTVCWML